MCDIYATCHNTTIPFLLYIYFSFNQRKNLLILSRECMDAMLVNIFGEAQGIHYSEVGLMSYISLSSVNIISLFCWVFTCTLGIL